MPLPGKPPGYQFRDILQQGGAKEFPATQVLAYKWHTNPPIPGLKFPQYEAIKNKVLHGACPDCDFEVCAVPEDAQMPRSFFMHLRARHADGSHGMNRAEALAEMEAQGLPIKARFAVQSDALVQEGERRREEAREQVATPA